LPLALKENRFCRVDADKATPDSPSCNTPDAAAPQRTASGCAADTLSLLSHAAARSENEGWGWREGGGGATALRSPVRGMGALQKLLNTPTCTDAAASTWGGGDGMLCFAAKGDGDAGGGAAHGSKLLGEGGGGLERVEKTEFDSHGGKENGQKEIPHQLTNLKEEFPHQVTNLRELLFGNEEYPREVTSFSDAPAPQERAAPKEQGYQNSEDDAHALQHALQHTLQYALQHTLCNAQGDQNSEDDAPGLITWRSGSQSSQCNSPSQKAYVSLSLSAASSPVLADGARDTAVDVSAVSTLTAVVG